MERDAKARAPVGASVRLRPRPPTRPSRRPQRVPTKAYSSRDRPSATITLRPPRLVRIESKPASRISTAASTAMRSCRRPAGLARNVEAATRTSRRPSPRDVAPTSTDTALLRSLSACPVRRRNAVPTVTTPISRAARPRQCGGVGDLVADRLRITLRADEIGNGGADHAQSHRGAVAQPRGHGGQLRRDRNVHRGAHRADGHAQPAAGGMATLAAFQMPKPAVAPSAGASAVSPSGKANRSRPGTSWAASERADSARMTERTARRRIMAGYPARRARSSARTLPPSVVVR